ncbi:MAG: phytanoyl-CoA dioxygenase family protein [Rhizobiaceae bacterium]|nr:phytanoyl-CoA dioxygenase family protein [Rhizobiaceae bacterium]
MSDLSSQPRTADNRPPLTAVKLEADGKTLETSTHRLGYLEPSFLDEGVSALRARYDANGYVWIKGLLDPDEVRGFRGWVFGHLAVSGLLEDGTDPVDGISVTGDYDAKLAERRLMSIVKSARFEGFCAQPRLTSFMDQFIGELSYLHKRKIMRYTRPKTPVATAAHYDLVYLRGGTSDLVTAWIPVGDISIDEGGLLYLRDSHALGMQMEADFAEKNKSLPPEERISAFNQNMTSGGWVSKDLPDMANKFDTQWLVADYEAGDVVLHSPYFIHASTNNKSAAGRMRLSTDIRFQSVDDKIDARWSNHWSLDDKL